MERLLLCLILFTLIACDGLQKSKKPDQSPKTISINKFINLLDTSEVLNKKTVVSLEFDFDQGGIRFSAFMEEDDIKYRYIKRDTTIYKDPCIEFFLDPGADGLNYYEMQFNARPQVWDLKLRSAKGHINAPENMMDWDIGQDWKIGIDGLANNSDTKDRSWYLSGYLDAKCFSEGLPKSGETWAYNFMRIDYDENRNPTYWVAYPTGKHMIHYPQAWPTITF